jgi:hypothetical protein
VSFWWQRGGHVTRLGDTTAGGDGNATAKFKAPRSAFKGAVQIEAIATDTSAGTATLRIVANDDKKSTKNKHGPKHKSRQKKRSKRARGKE